MPSGNGEEPGQPGLRPTAPRGALDRRRGDRRQLADCEKGRSMTRFEEDATSPLRVRLEQLAGTGSGGDSINGGDLYRRGIRRRRRRVAATTALIAASVVVAGAAIGSVRPEASQQIGPAPASNPACEIPDSWTPAIEAGAL